jgi:hypothetical protein
MRRLIYQKIAATGINWAFGPVSFSTQSDLVFDGIEWNAVPSDLVEGLLQWRISFKEEISRGKRDGAFPRLVQNGLADLR